MAKERVDRTRKVVRRNSTQPLRFICSPLILLLVSKNPQTAEIISPYTPCTASPCSSSTMTGPIFPHCVCSTNASDFSFFFFFSPSSSVVPVLNRSFLSFCCWNHPSPPRCRSVHAATRAHRPRRDPVPARGRTHDVSRSDVRGRATPSRGRGAARGDAHRVRRGG